MFSSFKRECIVYSVYIGLFMLYVFPIDFLGAQPISQFWSCILIYVISLFDLFAINRLNEFVIIRFTRINKLYRIKIKKSMLLCFRLSIFFYMMSFILSFFSEKCVVIEMIPFSIFLFINLMISDILLFLFDRIKRVKMMKLFLIVNIALSFIMVQSGIIKYNILFYPMTFNQLLVHNVGVLQWLDILLSYLIISYIIYILMEVKCYAD